jgi:hypothetical protein
MAHVGIGFRGQQGFCLGGVRDDFLVFEIQFDRFGRLACSLASWA